MIDKDELKQLLIQGNSTRDIAKILDCGKTTVGSYVKKYNLTEFYSNKSPKKAIKFNKIDSKEKAYCLGFILADGSINIDNTIDIVVSLDDKEVIDFISSVLDSEISISTKLNKKTKTFPRARTCRKINDITKFTGGRLKVDRHYPRVPTKFERYLLQGFFDGDGCITWGKRKDRNKIWHKISFTSQLKLLTGIQQMLIKNLGISTVVRPKSGENCFVLEFSNKKDVLKFCNYLYKDNDMIVLKRKYNKFKALRLELEEFGER